ncbi:MAG: Glutaryl-7-aminocephalosporanic-acid acylase [Flavobacteriales bacterium]|nr:MAG: Glutaryl-7-aminocephalosporanic-acid acylase [Flavobacteriales bacterium]
MRLVLFLFFLSLANSQINPKNIEIVRDIYGVPHIYAKTDAEVAYGLAWVNAEDDFKTIQVAYLAGNAMLSNYIGLKGAPADFISQLIGSSNLIDEKIDQISKDYMEVVKGYSQGLNAYAKDNPDKVLFKKLFPITPKKMLMYSQLQLFISNEGAYWAGKILNNDTQDDFLDQNLTGSNVIAMNRNKTMSGETFLAINTHQPLEGPTSWYEVHLNSEEGTNIIGTMYPGTPNVLIGVNENLGWSHTVNYPDKTDVFKLRMKNRRKYIVDNKEYNLEKHKAKISLKVLGIPIKINRKYYKSIYGPTLKNKSGYYSIRTPTLFNIRALEQWWKMGKAKNFSEFYNIYKMKQIPGFNVGYADKYDTIFYMSNAILPKRAEGYNWKGIVPGDTMKTLWTEYHNIESLPQVIQPKSGFIYNANHSPFKSTSAEENPKEEDYSERLGYETYDNNRSTRLIELIESYDKVTYDDFKRIKYDNSFPSKFNYNFMDISIIESLKLEKEHELFVILDIIQKWDRKTDIDSQGAGFYGVLYYQLVSSYRDDIQRNNNTVSKKTLLSALKDVKRYLIDNFESTDITLGDFQKLVRGDKELPIWGLPDVITAMSSRPYKDGMRKVTQGESYIGLVRFNKEGPILESVISFGNSDDPSSDHYTDQMEMYSKFQTKKMTFNKGDIYKNAKSIYNPN